MNSTGLSVAPIKICLISQQWCETPTVAAHAFDEKCLRWWGDSETGSGVLVALQWEARKQNYAFELYSIGPTRSSSVNLVQRFATAFHLTVPVGATFGCVATLKDSRRR